MQSIFKQGSLIVSIAISLIEVCRVSEGMVMGNSVEAERLTEVISMSSSTMFMDTLRFWCPPVCPATFSFPLDTPIEPCSMSCSIFFIKRSCSNFLTVKASCLRNSLEYKKKYILIIICACANFFFFICTWLHLFPQNWHASSLICDVIRWNFQLVHHHNQLSAEYCQQVSKSIFLRKIEHEINIGFHKSKMI